MGACRGRQRGLLLLGTPFAAAELTLIAWTTVGFGVLLFLADRLGMTLRRVEHMAGLTSLLIGLAQVIAFIPGAGRIGVTVTAARLLGFERTEAARFAMLLSLVPLLVAAGWPTWMLRLDGTSVLGTGGAIAAAITFVATYATIAFLMRWLRRGTFAPFAIYRLIVGGGLLYAIYT